MENDDLQQRVKRIEDYLGFGGGAGSLKLEVIEKKLDNIRKAMVSLIARLTDVEVRPAIYAELNDLKEQLDEVDKVLTRRGRTMSAGS